MIIRKQSILLLVGLGWLLIRPLAVAQAACGSWIASPSGCYDTDYNLLPGQAVQCGNGACCNTQAECTPEEEDPFGNIDDPVTPADDEPEQNAACGGAQFGTCPQEGETCQRLYQANSDSLEYVCAPPSTRCEGDHYGTCPTAQGCFRLTITGGETTYACFTDGDPEVILDPSQNGFPMIPEERDSLIFQQCGTFWSTDNGGRCFNANTNEVVSPYAMCSDYGGNATACCASPSLCLLATMDVEDLEPDEEEESDFVCGEYRTTGYLRGCYGVDNKLIADPVDCGSAGYAVQCCSAAEFCGSNPSVHADKEDFDYCLQVPDDGQRDACNTCIGQGDPGEYIFSAVGCVRVSGKGLAEDLIRLLLGIAGGAAFLSILAAAFKLTTSKGDTNQVKEAKELILAAVSGLLFMIFSIIILDFIGVEVLHLPGLGGGSTGAPSQSQTQTTNSPTQTYVPARSVPQGGDCEHDLQCDGSLPLLCLAGTCQLPEDDVAEGSAAIGESCYYYHDCRQQIEVNGTTQAATVDCEDRRCQVRTLNAPCSQQPNPDQYCQETLGDNDAFCRTTDSGLNVCVIPVSIPEKISCYSYQDQNYCNQMMGSSTNAYECFTPASTPGTGYCRERQE